LRHGGLPVDRRGSVSGAPAVAQKRKPPGGAGGSCRISVLGVSYARIPDSSRRQAGKPKKYEK
jgi:hypothetical protein